MSYRCFCLDSAPEMAGRFEDISEELGWANQLLETF